MNDKIAEHGVKLVIEGSTGSGKTTLIQRLAGLWDSYELRGFITRKEAPGFDGVCNVYMHPAYLPVSERVYREYNRIGACKNRSSLPNPQTFEDYGISLLKDIPKKALIVMDELGFMENDAHNFQSRVIELLSANNPNLVIAAIKDKPTPFLDRIRERPGIVLRQIDEHNREELFQSLLKWIPSLIKRPTQ